MLKLLVVQLLQLDPDEGIELGASKIRVLKLLQELGAEAAKRARLIRNLIWAPKV